MSQPFCWRLKIDLVKFERIEKNVMEGSMDAFSNLFGWLTGQWTNQNSIGKAFLGCALLLVIACVCGVPLLLISLMEI